MFEKLQTQVNFAKQEEEILKFWKDNKIFERSLEERKKSQYFSFYDGPPFATGLPHYGHLLASYIKDVIPRYKTMKGYHVPRRFGWDCHGLPVEMLIQEELSLSTPEDIRAFGEDKFNEACRASVMKYNDEWEKTIDRVGRWVDFKNGYKTMDTTFMESIWWVFKQMYDKGLIYEGHKVLPYSWKASTSLSNFEANSNYKSVQDPAVTVRLKLIDEENAYLLIWTTTPWTLVSNLGVCVNAKLTYLKVKSKKDGAFYYVNKELLESNFGKDEVEVLAELKGGDLKGKRYKSLFSYMDSLMDVSKAYRVFVDDYATNETGTGMVHLAPYGEDDYRVLTDNGVGIYDVIDENGCYILEVTEFAKQFVKDADKNIIAKLKSDGVLMKQDTIQHNYPFCWRTDTPLLYKPISTWFVRVTELKDKMIEANRKINWVPNHIKEGRFGNWLENVKDWDIARNRFWGTPLPLWKSEDGDIICLGSVEELKSYTGKTFNDLHKHIIDEVVLEKNGKKYRRIPQVLDCWFESGSMPFSQSHYPFENKEFVEKTIPADFIGEGLDQTRGWFYTLLVISTAMGEEMPFKNVIVNGLVLAEDGRKMSKRLKNYPDPHYVLDTYGSDALRMYMISSAVVKAEYLKFAEAGVKDILKTVVIPLWNSLSFLTTYANIDGWDSRKDGTKLEALENSLDKWIVSYVQQLVKDITESMDGYDLQKTLPPLTVFIDKLTNWYIRRSRRRFWKSQNDQDKFDAYTTLYYVLVTLSKVVAPFMPFLSERMYAVLTGGKEKLSVHLEDFPVYDATKRNESLEEEMFWIQSVSELGRSMRSKEKLKVRQPLKSMTIISKNEKIIAALEANKSIILEELNVKSIEYSKDEEKYLEIGCNPNFATMGKKYGALLKDLNVLVRGFQSKEIATLEKEGGITLTVQGQSVTLNTEDVLIVRKQKMGFPVSTDGELSIMLNTDVDEALVLEGLARDLVNLIQKTRKDMDLEYTHRIDIAFSKDDRLQALVKAHEEYIQSETLTNKIEYVESLKGDDVQSVELDAKWTIRMKITTA